VLSDGRLVLCEGVSALYATIVLSDGRLVSCEGVSTW